MNPTLVRLLVASMVVASSCVVAQSTELPDSISGRWSWVERNLGQTFSRNDIKAQPDQSFTAKLTWWTIDPKCSIRGTPIVGKLTSTGLAFDARTKCDQTFAAELGRASSGWVGKATTTCGNTVVVEMKAN
ncbi:MAG: hypothetical protein H6930_00890 [Rhodoferax sp.]|nr:hypothetical protein [Rhodoferax sp.]